MRTALKEWSVIISAMKEGVHHYLLRKGGLADKGQTFKLEHSKFLFFPTYEHQKKEMIQTKYHSIYDKAVLDTPSNELLTIDTWAEVKETREVKTLKDLQKILPYTIWSEEYFQMRLNYKPEKPLFLLLLRVVRLKTPHTISNLRKYGGCRSWVEIEEELDIS